MTTPEEFARKMGRCADELGSAARRGVNAGAVRVGHAADVSLLHATGDRKLSGTHSDRPMSVGVSKARSDTNPHATVAGKPAGLWSWLERGTKMRVVGAGRGVSSVGRNMHGVTVGLRRSKSGKIRTTTTATLLHWGDVWAYGPFSVGRSPAKRTFSRAINISSGEVVKLVHKETLKTIVRAVR